MIEFALIYVACIFLSAILFTALNNVWDRELNTYQITCMSLVWPLSVLAFFVAFVVEYFSKG